MSEPIHILYIDDSALDRELVRDMLEKEHGGFEVTEAASREDLERCLEVGPYDVLLTDFNILGFTGLEVFDHIQTRLPTLPVIILTGTGSEEVAVEAMRRGVADYVVKTQAQIRRLPQTILGVLEKNRLQQERKKAEMELAETLEDLKRSKAETEALLEASNSLLQMKGFQFAANRIFDCCKQVIGADAGYIVILKGEAFDSETVYLDSGKKTCTVDPDLPLHLRGLRKEVIQSGQPIYDNDFTSSRWTALLPEGHADIQNVLFAPLKIEGTPVGVLGMADKPGGFDDHDAELANAFAEFTSIGLLHARADEALKQSELKYRTLIDSLPLCAAIFQDEKIAFINPAGARMLGYREPDQLLGMDTLTFFPDREKERLSTCHNAHRTGDTDVPRNYTTELLRCNGEEFPAEVFVQLINYQGRQAHQILAIDISARRRLEEQLRQAQKMEAIGTLAGGIAHDFNNLLQIISGYAEFLAMELAPRDVGREELTAIRESADRGADLVNRILTFSRKVGSKLEPTNLNDEVRLAERILYRTLPKMIRIELRLEEALPPILADKPQVEQLLINIAVNAKDAMPEGGELIFETSNVHLDEEFCKNRIELTPGDYVMLRISDTGHGMEKDSLPHIFDPFFTTKGPGEGTGLGLSVVFGIVKMHKGHITCHSEPGEGTAFKIYFPIARPEGTREGQRVLPMPAGGTETILVVDDEELIAALAKRLLEKAGYRVFTAGSGKQALEIYEKDKDEISLVLLDLIMPEMGGKQCLEELLKIDPQVKALIASGFGIKGETKKFLNTASKGAVSKPFKLRELLQTVRDVLDGT